MIERIERNRLFQCDCTLDMVDKIIMPTTLLPVVCKGLVKNLTGYFNTYDLKLLPSYSLIKPSSTGKPSIKLQQNSIEGFSPFVVPMNDNGDDDSTDSSQSDIQVRSFEFPRSSCRGYKRVVSFGKRIIVVD